MMIKCENHGFGKHEMTWECGCSMFCFWKILTRFECDVYLVWERSIVHAQVLSELVVSYDKRNP